MKMFVLVAVFLSLGHTASGQDFNTRLVKKLGEMMGAKPQIIEIELVSQRKLLESYRGMLFAECLNGHPTRFEYCAQTVTVSGIFVHGMWFKEKNPDHLHILVHKNSNSIDVIIHEYAHWYLNRVNPLLNNHTTLGTLAREILISPVLLEWLEKEQK